MKTLNLITPLAGNLSCKISHFPDGQQDITLLSSFTLNSILSNPVPIQIISRFNSFEDLELIICATKALRNLKIKEIHLYIPYILGARSDRQFVTGGTSYLRDVIAPILNSLNFEEVICLDAHSDVASACINNLVVESNCNFAAKAIADIKSNSNQEIMVISPDAGALKKIYKVVDHIQFKGTVVVCSKHRDSDGKLSKTIVPLDTLEDHQFVIIDDICDGGRTFINIAQEIRRLYDGLPWNCKIYLIVTHGIFSAGFDELSKWVDKIYCTNSVKDIEVEDYQHSTEKGSSLVKQFNIF